MGKTDQQLSEHLKRTEVQCHCGCGFADMKPGMVHLFERIRALCCQIKGRDVPIIVNSGCRCREHNKAIGGAKNSQHVRGNALDLRCPDGFTIDAFAGVCDTLNQTGAVIVYRKRNFIHVDDRGTKVRSEK